MPLNIDMPTVTEALSTAADSTVPTRNPAVSKILEPLRTDALVPLREALVEVLDALDAVDSAADTLDQAEASEREGAHEDLVETLADLRDQLVGIGLVPVPDEPAA